MMLKFPESINTSKMAKHATELTTTDELLNALESRHLVVAWDDCNPDEEPIKVWGFLNSVTYTDPKTHVCEVITELCAGYLGKLKYQHVARVEDDDCPQVFYNNGTRKNVGHLVGLVEDSARDTYDCVVRVPPFNKPCVDMCNISGVCFVDDIKLGIERKPAEEKANA
jgi:hypothetical protein